MKKNKKIIIIAILILLVPMTVFGIGWLFKSKSTKVVNGNIHTVDVEVEESQNEIESVGLVPGDNIEKNIKIKPKGSTPSFLRVKVNNNWIVDNKSLISANDAIDVVYNESVEFGGDNGQWYKGRDGYLYYLNLVDGESQTIPLIDKLSFTGELKDESGNIVGGDINDYQNKSLKFSVDVQVIQAKNNAFESEWKISQESDSKLNTKLTELSSNL